MKTTLDSEIIYDAFDRHGLPILRIDGFEKGNYAKIRIELGEKFRLALRFLFPNSIFSYPLGSPVLVKW